MAGFIGERLQGTTDTITRDIMSAHFVPLNQRAVRNVVALHRTHIHMRSHEVKFTKNGLARAYSFHKISITFLFGLPRPTMRLLLFRSKTCASKVCMINSKEGAARLRLQVGTRSMAQWRWNYYHYHAFMLVFFIKAAAQLKRRAGFCRGSIWTNLSILPGSRPNPLYSWLPPNVGFEFATQWTSLMMSSHCCLHHRFAGLGNRWFSKICLLPVRPRTN